MNRLISYLILISELCLYIWYLWDVPKRQQKKAGNIVLFLILGILWYVLRSIVYDHSFVYVFLLLLIATLVIFRVKITLAIYLSSVYTAYIYVAGIVTIYPLFLLRYGSLPAGMDYLQQPILLLCELLSLFLKIISIGLFRRLIPSIMKVRLNWIQVINALSPILIAFVMDSISAALLQAHSEQYQFVLVRLIFLLSFIIYVSSAASTLAIRYQYRDLENMQIQQKMKDQYLLFEQNKSREEEIRKISHDMKNHLIVISQLASIPQIRTYTSSIIGQLESLEKIEYTHNLIVDSLVNSKTSYLKEHRIALKIIADFRELNGIDDVDLCTIFGNAFDNAIEAVSEVTDPDKRMISIKSYSQSGMWLLQVENYFHGTLKQHEGILQSSHGEMRGLGLKSIEYALKKYNGEMSFDVKEDYFTLKLVWPVI